MKYYRAVAEKYDYFTGYGTIINELVTAKEKEKRFPHLSGAAFEVVEISKKAIYWSFGARFEVGTGSTYDKGGRFVLCDGHKLYVN